MGEGNPEHSNDNSNGGGSQFQTLALELGLMNSLRTGNVMFDILICSIVPPIFALLRSVFDEIYNALFMLWILLTSQPKKTYVWDITFSRTTNSHGNELQSDSRTDVLQKALTKYVGKLILENESLRDKMLSADVQLMKQTHDKKNGHSYQNNFRYNGSGLDSGEKSIYDHLRSYSLFFLPEDQGTLELEPGLKFSVRHDAPNSNGGGEENGSAGGGNGDFTTKTKVITLEAEGPDGRERIDRFVEQAFRAYKQDLGAKEDISRYMYVLKTLTSDSSNNNNGGNSGNVHTYKKYILSENKTLDTIWFPEKAATVKLLNAFQAKTGKFAIDGFPHKLGLLLYGPPGTGKTSLIKAIAQYTKRHVVSIPLAKLRTNAELQDIMMGLKFGIPGQSFPDKLSLEKVVFVMEDIDCMSHIVQKRGGAEVEEDPESDDEEEANEDDKKKDKKRGKGGAKGTLGNDSLKVEEEDDDDDSDSGLMVTVMRKKANDKLNLAGLLNVLDGIVDSPSRILIMTTNHPEKLDPALTRPGRINKSILMTNMILDDAVKMIEHFFDERMSNEQVERLESFVCSRTDYDKDLQDMWRTLGTGNTNTSTAIRYQNCLTPAELEQYCAEVDDIDTLLALIDREMRERTEKVLLSASS